jgi:predicted RNase H-related nuclease YkuK (DUF458 family)
MMFCSPSRGPLTFEAMFEDIAEYMKEDPGCNYKLIIGTDSQNRDHVTFVTAVVVHRIGKGGRYYYTKRRDRKISSLRQRIFFEASLSLSVASRIAEQLSRDGHSKMNVEIHLDIGQNGETKEMVREIIGMVMGSGFDAKIKPNSYGASKVADKHTK